MTVQGEFDLEGKALDSRPGKLCFAVSGKARLVGPTGKRYAEVTDIAVEDLI